jgi:outer membrane protein assembly factor BamD
MRDRWLSWVRMVMVALALGGCSSFGTSPDETANWSADRLYAEAREAMGTGNYTRAIKMLETLEGRFPYGRYAQQAILDAAYANYKAGEHAAAIAGADRFIKTFPNHPAVDYAYYLKGLANFNDDQGFLGYVVEVDLSARDPKSAREAYLTFRELAQRFPQSRYAEDAIARANYLVNALAMYEVHVARYYFNRGAYLSAANRAQRALTTYPRTPANEDALALLVQSYDRLELPQLRDDARRVLESTYPESPHVTGKKVETPWWSYRSWFNRVW